MSFEYRFRLGLSSKNITCAILLGTHCILSLGINTIYIALIIKVTTAVRYYIRLTDGAGEHWKGPGYCLVEVTAVFVPVAPKEMALVTQVQRAIWRKQYPAWLEFKGASQLSVSRP